MLPFPTMIEFGLPRRRLRPGEEEGPRWGDDIDAMKMRPDPQVPETVPYLDLLKSQAASAPAPVNPITAAMTAPPPAAAPQAPVAPQSPPSPARTPFKLKYFSGDVLPAQPGYQRLGGGTLNTPGDFGLNDPVEQDRRMEWANINAMGMTPAQYEAAMNQPQALPPTFKRTFSNGPGDTVTYDMASGPNGVRYTGTGREADQAPFVFDAGQSNMGQQNAELAAWQAANARSTAMADPKLAGALMLEDLRGKYGVQEAEARRKDVINSKIIEAALFNQQRTYESTGDPAAAKAAFDRTMGIAGSALPPDVAALLGQGGQPAAPGQPSTPGGPPPLNPIAASTIDQDAASILAQPGDYNVGRGETLLKNFGNYKDSAQRRAAIKALLANRPNLDQIGDMILTTAANKFLLQTPRSTANPRDYGAGDTGLPFGIDFKSAIPLPFLGIGVQTGTPEAFIGSRRVPLPQSVRPGTQTGSFLGVNTSAEDLRNAAALNPILADFFAELQAAGYGR